jgi:hypothetical protein
MKCKIHPTYTGKNRPRIDCFQCHCLYAEKELKRITKKLAKTSADITNRKETVVSLGGVKKQLLLLANAILKSVNALSKLG